jgi:lysozyme
VTDLDRDALRKQLIRHEGLRLKPYKDSMGILTIGVGRNLDHVGLYEDEAMFMLERDIDRCLTGLAKRYAWFKDLGAVRQRALVDLAFNLGFATLATFTGTLAALARGDYEDAADHLQASLWYRQVASRGPRIVGMIRTGQA